jgi:hypothetical protein
VFQVHPVGDAVGHALPFLDVAPDARLARLVEGGDAVAFDIRLAREAQLALDLDLHRQAVGIPPAPRTNHILPAHAPVADHDVLGRPRLDMVDAGPPVRRGRTFKKDKRPRSVAVPQRLLHDALLAPPRLDFLLQYGKPLLRIDRSKRHRSSFAAKRRFVRPYCPHYTTAHSGPWPCVSAQTMLSAQ